MVNFKIAGKSWTSDDMLVVIPCRYKELFEGHSFRDKETFSRALMFASCAAEAWYYDRNWVAERDERSLKEVLALN